jgi:hypothetical protein
MGDVDENLHVFYIQEVVGDVVSFGFQPIYLRRDNYKW